MGEEASDISLDSMASTTASDVLIRSTSVHVRKGDSRPSTANERMATGDSSPLHTADTGCHYPGASTLGHRQVASIDGSGCGDRDGRKVHISVKRLREVPTPVLPDFAFKKRDPSYIPPALPANKYPEVTLSIVDDARNGSTLQNMDSPSQRVLVTKHFQNMGEEKIVMKKPLDGSIQKNKDVQISQFTTGQKETLLVALNKRAQNGSGTKQVPVQLLEDVRGKGKKAGTSIGKNQETIEIQTASIAAATAAAIAATAPVLKVQSNLEAQVNSVSQLLNKLQEADRQLQILTEQHSKIPSQQPLERLYQGRVSELESKLTLLTEQRLQHLEKLQQQQLEMQSQFINSAIKVSASHRETAAPVCSHFPVSVPLPQTTAAPKNTEKVTAAAVQEVKENTGKSPLETPAPRRFAPVPISMDVPSKSLPGKENVEKPNPSTSGNVHFLHELLGRDNTPLSGSTYKTHIPLNLTTTDSRPFGDSYIQNKEAYGAQISSLTSSTAVKKANDVLQDLNSLKQEMQSMMKDAKQWKSQEAVLKPREKTILLSTSLSKSPVLWRRAVNPPKSMIDDAECILRELQNKRKVLEDNLEAIARANDGARKYSLISALASDSNEAEKIRIQKTVDACITEITSEIKDELAKEDLRKKKSNESCKESAVRRNAGSAKDIKENRYLDIKAPASGAMRSTKPSSGVSAKPQFKKTGEKLAGQSKRALPKNDESSKVPQKVNVSSVMDEEMLNRVYGTPVYQGRRSTLKKGPYLRFGSPPAKTKPQRPKVMETVRGVKLKSAKIQTSSPKMERGLIKPRSPEFSVPRNYTPQYVFIPTREADASDAQMQGHLIEMAIPLGRPRFDRAAPLPHSVILADPQPVVNVSIPPMPPKPKADVVKPNIAVVEMRSEKKDPPQLTVQVLPCVDIDSITSDSPGTTHRTPSPHPTHRTPSPDIPPCTPSPVKTDIQMPESVETEEEILAFPGTTLEETDITPDDQVEEVPEPLLELNGFGDTNPPQHGGIPFPLPAPALQTNADILDGIATSRETLVNRLVSRVELEIFDRIISEMHSGREDVIPHVTLSSNENSDSVSTESDAAGGEGLQFLFDGVPVESSLIRQYVEEALAKAVAKILAERRTQRIPPSPPAQTVAQPTPVEVTPVPTPECTPPSSPLPPPRETAIVKTPELSPQTSLEEPELQQDAGQMVPLTQVVTPTMTPVASPTRVNTPTSLISEDNVKQSSIKSANAWNSTELPLEEENPHSLKEAVQYKDAVVMTVAEEEDPKSLISVTPEPQKPIVVSPKQEALSPAPSTYSSSTEESSVTITESDTTDKPLSEGEVLYSYGQIIVPNALAAGGLGYPNLTESLSSTLKDANDMEFDPPSEGQVMDRPFRVGHQEPSRLLLAKLNPGSRTRQEVFYHPESSGDENSMGEISEGQRLCLTPAAEQILMGHSALIDRTGTTGQTAGHLQIRPSSNWQQINIPGVGQGDADNLSSGPMSLGDLESQLLPAYYPQAEDLHQIPAAARNTSQGPGEPQREHQPAPTRFIQVGVKSSDDPQQGIREDSDRTLVEPSVYLTDSAAEPLKKMSVTLPSMMEDDEDVKSPLEESESSGADFF
ncbi:protein TALPID3 isoform X2 [Hyla sarda]|uniref:protein TALPID3 isoform X2 n=1 Tax=Hyla sarda TaxID=327740 RepID=UPI0024C4063C|nr:protein TALPID3 isoform X2 [Hyla sarda]